MSFYDRKACPICGRVVNMYGANQCQSCTPKKEREPARLTPDCRTKQEILSDFYKNGFQ